MNAQSRTFASLLHRHRLAAGLSQEALAERAGLSRRGVSDLERGVKRMPHLHTVHSLADALRLEGQERAQFAALARGQESPAPRERAPQPGVFAWHSLPLVDRRHELAFLDDHLAGRTPPLLLVAGEPGIGKSRFLVEAAARAEEQGWRVITGGCTRRSGQEPYEPFVSTLARELRHTPQARQRMDLQGCGWLVRLLPELLETRIAPAPTWSLPPEQERRLMFGAVVCYLANVAGPAGTLLILDDLQWAGADALALLATLLDGMADSTSPALRIVAAYRDTEALLADPLGLLVAELVGAGRAARISLSLLTRDEAQTLLEQVWWDMPMDAPVSMPGMLQDEILRRADGLPFYIVSSARAVQTRQRDEEGNITAHIPSSVAESIRTRLAVLPEAARELLGVAAVGGRLIAGVLLMAVASLAETEILDALDRLRQARLLVETEEDSYRFTHDLIREVVEADLGARRRRVLHRRMAQALEQFTFPERGPRAADLAYHFSEAGDFGAALPYALLAGDQAEAAFAHVEASAHFRAAIRYSEAPGDLPRKAEALEKLGVSLLRFGHTDPALAALEEAAALYVELNDQESRYRALAALIQTHWQRGTAEEGLEKVRSILTAEEARENLRASPALAALYNSICSAHRHDGQYEERVHAAKRLEQIARELHDDALLFAALQHQIHAANLSGLGAPGLGAYLDLAPLAERTGDPVILLEFYNNISAEYLFAGEFSLSQAYNKRALEQTQRAGGPHHMTRMLINRAELHYYIGAWAAARADISQADAIASESDRFGITYSSLYRPLLRGELDMAEGHEKLARQCLDHVIKKALESRDLQAMAMSGSCLAELDLVEGRVAEVYAYLAPLLDQLHGAPEFTKFVHPFRAWALLDMGRHQEASQEIGICIASMEARTERLRLMDALRVRALIAMRQERYQEAASDLDEAIALCQAMPYPYAEAKALWVYGRLEMARGDPVAAHQRFEQALAICDRLGEGLYRRHIERDLRRLAQKG